MRLSSLLPVVMLGFLISAKDCQQYAVMFYLVNPNSPLQEKWTVNPEITDNINLFNKWLKVWTQACSGTCDPVDAGPVRGGPGYTWRMVCRAARAHKQMPLGTVPAKMTATTGWNITEETHCNVNCVPNSHQGCGFDFGHCKH
ncbi:hypothetical protein FKW77_010599 [Venturia effusa]|uniref:Uncharacterized protein n=1 Tax=Venturia effusa TaxID=50376 RepID=A0A517KXX0_9PEZI|nr:hypothetical protein FKW77_010599 [Venturia effusa]